MGCPKITYKPKLEVIQNEKLEIRNHPKFLISHSQVLIEEVHIARAGFQAAAHGVFQGFVSTISGGNFEQGFVSGALSSIASSAFQGFGGEFAKKGAGTILFGTVAGGVGASLTGGDFLFGAAQGLVVSSLNHVAHESENWFQKRGDKSNIINWIDGSKDPELYKKAQSDNKPKLRIRKSITT